MKMAMGGNPLAGAIPGGGSAEPAAAPAGPSEEEIQARLEAEERRKDKHRKMEGEREKMRKGIRDKYNIEKKDNDPFAMPVTGLDGRIGAPGKDADDSLLGKVGLGEAGAKATAAFDSIKGFLPFGK